MDGVNDREGSGEIVLAREGFGVEAERARRFEAHLSVLLINVDGLGLVNDTLGKVAGDHVLGLLGDLVRANTRKIDVFGRWDRDDFVILTVDRNRFGCVALAEKLRKSISEATFDWDGREVKMTVSIGVARGVPGNEKEIDALIGTARKAVTLAKSKGRNRVEFLDVPTGELSRLSRPTPK